MKTKNYLLALFVVIAVKNSGLSQNIYIDSLVCLEVNGIATNNKEPLGNVNVKLYMENEEMEMTEVTNVEHHDHSFSFKLQRNKHYTIEISKPGYFTRFVSISTNLPDNISSKPLFTFDFEVEMVKTTPVTDDYYLDFPIALIDYNNEKGVFVMHGKYTANIKKKLNGTMQQPTANGIKKK